MAGFCPFPVCTARLRTPHSVSSGVGDKAAIKAYVSKHLPMVTDQPQSIHHLPPSSFEAHSNSILEKQEQEMRFNALMQSGLSTAEFKKQKQREFARMMQDAIAKADALKTGAGNWANSPPDLQALLEHIGGGASFGSSAFTRKRGFVVEEVSLA